MLNTQKMKYLRSCCSRARSDHLKQYSKSAKCLQTPKWPVDSHRDDDDDVWKQKAGNMSRVIWRPHSQLPSAHTRQIPRRWFSFKSGNFHIFSLNFLSSSNGVSGITYSGSWIGSWNTFQTLRKTKIHFLSFWQPRQSVQQGGGNFWLKIRLSEFYFKKAFKSKL